MRSEVRSSRCASDGNELGASAIEFALVLPLFLLLLLGLIHYGLVFALSISLTAAASDASRAAVSADPEADGYEDLVTARARAVASARLDWLPSEAREAVLGASGEKVEVAIESEPGVGSMVRVNVRYPGYSSSPLVPAFSLPGLGPVPPLPESLGGSATAPL